VKKSEHGMRVHHMFISLMEFDTRVYHLTGSRSIMALNHCVRISEPAKIKVMQTPRKVPAIQRARMSVVLSTVIRVCRMFKYARESPSCPFTNGNSERMDGC